MDMHTIFSDVTFIVYFLYKSYLGGGLSALASGQWAIFSNHYHIYICWVIEEIWIVVKE